MCECECRAPKRLQKMYGKFHSKQTTRSSDMKQNKRNDSVHTLDASWQNVQSECPILPFAFVKRWVNTGDKLTSAVTWHWGFGWALHRSLFIASALKVQRKTNRKFSNAEILSAGPAKRQIGVFWCTLVAEWFFDCFHRRFSHERATSTSKSLFT